MSFTRKIKRNGKIYLAEVENKWIDGKCVQKHIRYVGKECDGKTILASSISNIEIDEIKLYGPLLVLDYIAKEVGLSRHLGSYGNEILAMVYAHCLDYKSINKMEQWFSRTDLNMLMSLEQVTEHTLLNALDSLEKQDAHKLQSRIFEAVCKRYNLTPSAVVYDVTNTYFHGKQCPLGKLGKDKEGVKGRPLIQIGLAATKENGIPICHRVFHGNIHDARTLQDFITYFKSYQIKSGLFIHDRGIVSTQNIKDINQLQWHTLCGLPIKGNLAKIMRSMITDEQFILLKNRIRLNKTVFYVVSQPYNIGSVNGTLAVCFNENQRRELRESRYDEILHAQQLLALNKPIKSGLEKYFTKKGTIDNKKIEEAEEFDGYSCIFCTDKITKEDMVRFYFDKDMIEKAFRTMKGIARLQPIRHWLYNRVIAHVFICYLAYLLLSLLQYHLRKIGISAEEALAELETMYKVYMRDVKKDFKISRVVTLTKKQELILKTINPKLLKS